MDAQVIEQPVAASTCFHCGLPVTWGHRYSAFIDGVERAMCCPGCCAVAEGIAEAGLSDYYRYRTAAAVQQRTTAVPDQLRAFDLPEVQQTFVRCVDARIKEAALILNDVTCAACVWLIEKRVGALAGVTNFEVNYATRRARVTWDDTRIRLSEILNAVAAVGYRAQPFDSARSEEIHRRETRVILLRLSVAALAMMQVMMYATAVYFADGDMSGDIEALMRWVSLVLVTPVVFYSAGPFFSSAWRDLRGFRVGMDVPVALGIAVAFAASVWATLRAGGEVYYDSIAMFVFLLLLARFLESAARTRAVQSVEQLAKLVPAIAERLPHFPVTRATEQIAVARLAPGDHVLVRAGSTVPADGSVVEGTSRVDEALLTGESRPVAKHAGDAVIGGTMNIASPLYVRVERVGQQTVLATIVRLLDRAMMEKPRVAQLADRVAQRFLSALLVGAALVAAIWTLIEPSEALRITVSVLVVACPCALSLATPAALTAAAGNLARRGVLVTRGHTLEALAQATHFVFDKTGTLTSGRFRLTGVQPLGGSARAQCLAWAAALESSSEHPIGRALRDAVEGNVAVDVSGVVSHPGGGIEGRIGKDRMRIGTPAFVAELAGSAPAGLLQGIADDVSVVAMGHEALDGRSAWLALFTFGDPIRPEAHSVVNALLKLGKTVSVLSGDRSEVVRHIARELGIQHFVAGASPQDKLDHVRLLQANGAHVAMIGDGVNDAPVLAAANVSLAMSGSTDLARSSADAVLMNDRLQGVVAAVIVADRTGSVIKQNLGWAIAYNCAALPLAALGYVTPWMAGIGMAMSSLLVVANALRLTRPTRRPTRVEG